MITVQETYAKSVLRKSFHSSRLSLAPCCRQAWKVQSSQPRPFYLFIYSIFSEIHLSRMEYVKYSWKRKNFQDSSLFEAQTHVHNDKISFQNYTIILTFLLFHSHPSFIDKNTDWKYTKMLFNNSAILGPFSSRPHHLCGPIFPVYIFPLFSRY